MYRLRAAKVDDFVLAIRELHKEFNWPFPQHSVQDTKDQSNLFSPSSTLHSSTPSQELDTPTSETTPTIKRPPQDRTVAKESPNDDENSSLTSSLKRINRPPDLDLTKAQNQQLNVNLEPTQKPPDASVVIDNSRLLPPAVQGEFDPTRSSTPTRHSGSISERVSLVLKQNPCEFSVLYEICINLICLCAKLIAIPSWFFHLAFFYSSLVGFKCRR